MEWILYISLEDYVGIYNPNESSAWRSEHQ